MMDLDYYLNKSGRFSDSKYSEWWMAQYGGVITKTPSKEKIAEFSMTIDEAYSYTDRKAWVRISKNITIMKQVKENVPNDTFAFDDNPTNRYERRYILRYETGNRRCHDLICNNMTEVLTAVVKDYSEETSEW
jgi:hypothetical protein